MYELTVQKAEYVTMPVRLGRYSNSIETENVPFYPYSNDYWVDVVKKFNISIPKNIITLADGFTTCGNCGAKYVGKPGMCTNSVWLFEWNGNWNTQRVMGHMFVGEIYRRSPSDYHAYKVEKSYFGPCGSFNLFWTLDEEFRFQQSFFRMLEQLSALSNTDSSIMAPYKDLIPQYEMIEMNLMRARMMELELRNLQLVGVIKEIASRMSQAGSALNIGNL